MTVRSILAPAAIGAALLGAGSALAQDGTDGLAWATPEPSAIAEALADTTLPDAVPLDYAGLPVPSESDPLATVRAGLVYSEELGAGVLLGFEHRGPMGPGGQRFPLALDATYAQNGAAGRFALGMPGLFGGAYDGAVTLSYGTRDPFGAYTIERGRAAFSLGRSAGGLSGRAGIAWRSEEITDVNIFTSALVEESSRETVTLTGALGYEGRAMLSGTPLSYSFSIDGEVGQRTEGDGDFSRAEAEAALGLPIGRNYGLSLEVRGGQVSADDLLSSERFFGGERVMRGFTFGGIGPRDSASLGNDPVGGESYAAASLQIDRTLATVGAPNWTLGAFVDVGSVWGLSDAPETVDDELYWRSSAGLSLGWQVDALRLQIDLAEPIEERADDESERLRVSLSARF